MTNNSDQRAAPRFRCRSYASLNATNNANSQTWPAHLINLGESGALVAVLQDHAFEVGQQLTISIDLNNIDLNFKGTIAHVKQHYIGIKCEDMPKENFVAIQKQLDKPST